MVYLSVNCIHELESRRGKKSLYEYCLEVQVMYFDVFFSIVIASKIVYFDIKISTIRGTTIKYNVQSLKKSSSFIPYFLLMIDFIDI